MQIVIGIKQISAISVGASQFGKDRKLADLGMQYFGRTGVTIDQDCKIVWGCHTVQDVPKTLFETGCLQQPDRIRYWPFGPIEHRVQAIPP